MKKTTPSGTRTRVTKRPFGPHVALEDLADRFGQRGHLLQPAGNAFQAGFGQPQAIDQSGTETSLLGRRAVALIRLEQRTRPLANQCGGPRQPVVLLRTRRDGQLTRGLAVAQGHLPGIVWRDRPGPKLRDRRSYLAVSANAKSVSTRVYAPKRTKHECRLSPPSADEGSHRSLKHS